MLRTFKKLVFELVDIIDETAKESMAVNTIYKKKEKSSELIPMD